MSVVGLYFQLFWLHTIHHLSFLLVRSLKRLSSITTRLLKSVLPTKQDNDFCSSDCYICGIHHFRRRLVLLFILWSVWIPLIVCRICVSALWSMYQAPIVHHNFFRDPTDCVLLLEYIRKACLYRVLLYCIILPIHIILYSFH